MKKAMPDDPPYYLDIHGLKDEPGDEPDRRVGRRWIGVDFECCRIYSRIYKNKDGTAYVGNCPKCGRKVRVRVGPGGTSSRMFRAT